MFTTFRAKTRLNTAQTLSNTDIRSMRKRSGFGLALKLLIALSGLQLMAAPNAYAVEKIMVVGDSISAGWFRPSYRQALLDGLDNLSCNVEMVGSQSLTTYDYKSPNTHPGQHFPDFSPSNGDDTDHQAFPGIRADQLRDGHTSGSVTVLPIANYAATYQPDYVLLHAGTNDLAQALNWITVPGIPAWADTTADDMDGIIDDILSVVPGATIIVGNHIPRKGETSSTLISLENAMNTAYRNELTARISERADSRVLLADVATGFDSGNMTTDGIHPNAVGEQHIAGAFEAMLLGAGLCQNQGAIPAFVNPSPGGSIAGDTVTFDWVDNGLSVDNWWVFAGSTQAGQSDNYFNSQRINSSGTRSIDVTGLPENGSTVYVALWYKVNGMWDFTLSSFTSINGDGGSSGGSTSGTTGGTTGDTTGGTTGGTTTGGGSGTPAISTPASDSTITGSNFTLDWSDNGTAVSQWWVFAGSNAGDIQSDNYFNSGRISNSSASSITVSGMPQDGSTVYLRLWFKVDGTWQHDTVSYVSTATGGGTTSGGDTSAGTTSGGDTSGSDTSAGSTSGGDTSGGDTSGGTTGEGTTTGSDTTGGGNSGSPVIVTPTDNATIAGASFTLNWTDNGQSVTEWLIYAGSNGNDNKTRNYFNSGKITNSNASSVVVTGMPQNGSSVYVNLWYKISGQWFNTASVYTSGSGAGGSTSGGTTSGGSTGGSSTTGGSTTGGGSGTPGIVTPTSNATITSSSFTLNWSDNGESVTEWLVYAGSNGSDNKTRNYFNSGKITNSNASSVVVTGMPQNGGTVYVNLWYKVSGVWQVTSESYTSADGSGGSTGGGTTGGSASGGTTGGSGGGSNPPPLDLNNVTWLHTDVSDWPQSATMNSVTFTSTDICMNYNRANSWPSQNIFDADLVANAWVFIWNQSQSRWYGATWEWLRPGQTCKKQSAVDGNHIKRSPYAASSGWEPASGETLYFMVSGLARNDVRNVQARTQPVKVIWP